MYCADVCVTGAPAWHMVSLSELCLLRHPTYLMFINLAKDDAGEGQNTNTLACGPNLCMKKGGLIFKYQMQLRCRTYLTKNMILLAPLMSA